MKAFLIVHMLLRPETASCFHKQSDRLKEFIPETQGAVVVYVTCTRQNSGRGCETSQICVSENATRSGPCKACSVVSGLS